MIKIICIVLISSIGLIGQSKIIKSIDDLKGLEFGQGFEIVPFKLKDDLSNIDEFDKASGEIYDAYIKLFSKSSKEKSDDKFKKIRFLSADEIRKAFSVAENRKWAEMLGLEDCKNLKEPFLSKKIFEALNK